MRVLTADPKGGMLPIGYQGEHNIATQVVFPGLGGTEYTIVLLHRRRGDEMPYEVQQFEIVDGDVRWTVDQIDTAKVGYGTLQMQFYDIDGIAKTVIWQTKVSKSIGEMTEKAPDPYAMWYDKMVIEAGKAQEGMRKANDAADRAEGAKAAAASAANAAETAKISAQTAAGIASGAANAAASAANAAETAKNAAQTAAGIASGAANAAASAANAAETAKDTAQTAAHTANTASTEAKKAENAAAASAQTAANKKAEVDTVAGKAITDISTAKTNALGAIANKQSDAETAITEKTEEQLARIPEVTQLKADLTDIKTDLSPYVMKNLIGMVANTRYPCNILAGTTLTMSTADGEPISKSISLMGIYKDGDSEKTEMWNFNPSYSQRTITTVHDWHGMYWNATPPRPVQVEIGSEKTAYSEYMYIPPYSEVLGKVKKTDEIDGIQKNINTINSEIYKANNVAYDAMSNGWRLIDNGLCVLDSGYNLIKYPITVGKTYNVSNAEKWQFQSNASVPASGTPNRIGTTYNGDGKSDAPNGATYLIASAKIEQVVSVTENESKIGEALNDISIIKTNTFCKNLIGIRGGVLYPVEIPTGSTLTMSTADGNPLGQSEVALRFFDAEKHEFGFGGWNFNSSFSERTITVTNDGKTAYYVQWNKDISRAVQLEFGNKATEYQEYFTNVKYLPRLDQSPEEETATIKNTFISDCTDEDWETPAKRYAAELMNCVNAETFLFFTDPHMANQTGGNGMINGAYNRINFIQSVYNATQTNFCLCGGDWLGNSDVMQFAMHKLGFVDGFMRKKFESYVPVLGNHDTNYQGKQNAESANHTGRLSETTITNAWKKFREEHRAYYVYNAPNSKVYVFDTGTEAEAIASYQKTQLKWFAECLTNDNSEHIILAMHMLYSTYASKTVQPIAGEIFRIAEAYNNRSAITVDGISYSYAGTTGNIKFAILGHTHLDYNGVMNGIPFVCTTQTVESGKTTFDLCIADWDGNQLKMIRVGNGTDRTIQLN